MNLRRIEASSYREALAKVRAVYGEDALIVGTRTLQRGGVLGLGGRQVVEVYVTDTKKRAERLQAARAEVRAEKPQAPPFTPPEPPRESPGDPRPPVTPFPSVREAHEPPGTYAPPARPAPSPSVGRGVGRGASDPAVGARLKEINEALEELRGEVQRLLRRTEGPPWGHPVLEECYSILRNLDVEEEIARDILSGFDRSVLPSDGSFGNGALKGLLSGHIARFITNAAGTWPVSTGGVEVLVGPTGVGKTTSIAKLAARDRYQCGRKVALVTLDTFRIAAVDQLRKYADIIGLELRVVTDPGTFRRTVEELSSCDVIFVDSAGRSPADEMRVGELESFVKAVPEARVSLVLSLTAGARTLRQAVERFRRVGFSNLILTKLDETQSPGVILSAVAEARCPVTFVTNGQNVPDDLEAMDPQRLADLILKGG